MCDFPSWIKERGTGKIVYLRDEDFDALNDPDWDNSTGHNAIRRVYPGIKGEELDGWPCPAEMAADIKRHKLTRIARASGVVDCKITVEDRWFVVDYTYANGDHYVQRFRDGKLNDGPNGELAYERTYADGERCVQRYRDGQLNDGPNGEPAYERTSADGTHYVQRYRDGQRNDGPNGEPAYEYTSADGTHCVQRYRDGKLVNRSYRAAYTDNCLTNTRKN